MTFSLTSKALRSSSPIDLIAIFIISASGMPVDLCCFSRKYFPASIRLRLGSRPIISVPLTLSPLACAALHTSSKALCSGVALMSVMFIDTCAMPYSSMYQPIALQPFSVPGIITLLPSASLTILPFSLLALPRSLTSKATSFARAVEVVLRLKFTAMRKSLAPTLIAPLLAMVSLYSAGPKSGFNFSSAIFCGSASYSPLLQTARFFLSGVYAAAS